MIDSIVKWLGRLFGLALIVMVVVFAFGEEGFDFSKFDQKELFMLIALLLMVIGVIIGFFKQLIGAVVILIGYSIFALLEGRIFPGPIFPQFLIVALLYSYTGMQSPNK
jgi:hypothetical protein